MSISAAGAPPLARASRHRWRVVSVRVATTAVAVLAVAAIHISHRPATLCPLRALTGWPCPVCGSTTAAVALGHGDLAAAVRANPVTLLGGIAIIGAPAGLADWWRRRPVVWRVLATVLVVAVAEIWQLHRFGQL